MSGFYVSIVLLSAKFSSMLQGQPGVLELAIHALRGRSLSAEIEQFTEFGKLCLFRGLLTGIPRTALNANLMSIRDDAGCETTLASGSGSPFADKTWNIWTLLYDGILPALCRLCEGSMDSHFKFHTITAMQICLQQIKASILGRLTAAALDDFSQAARGHQITTQDYDPLPPSMVKQILTIVWNNWEDPLTQTVKQVQIVFDLVIDVQAVYLPLRGILSVDVKKARTPTVVEDSGVHLVEKQADDEMQIGLDQALDFTGLDFTGGDAPHELGRSLQRRPDGDGTGASNGTQQFLISIAADLLSVGGHRKGRYVPLASLCQRLGALKLLEISPSLLYETIFALADDDVCCSASCFLKSFLERLREEYWTSEGVTQGSLTFRRLWVPPILSGLASGNSKLRSNLSIYALPVALDIDPDSVLPMLDSVLKKPGAESWEVTRPPACDANLHHRSYRSEQGALDASIVDQYVGTLVSILKVARSLSLIEGEIMQNGKSVRQSNPSEAGLVNLETTSMPSAVFLIRGQPISVSVELLESAMSHLEDGVRVDVAELLCLSPKTASMPSQLELKLLCIALPLNMRCSSTGFRMKWISILKKFFVRVRTAVERQQKLEHDIGKKLMKADESTDNVGEPKASATKLQAGTVSHAGDNDVAAGVTVGTMQSFMQWLTQLVMSSLYPSAPYERRSMAMEILNAIIDVWSLCEPSVQRLGRYTSSPFVRNTFSPYSKAILSPETSAVVFASVVDSWDRLREAAFKVLTRYPTPLPGFDDGSAIEVLLGWVKELVSSPRVRESDAGALALRLIFRKYVCELGWTIKLHPEPHVVKKARTSAESKPSVGEIGAAIGEYLESLNDWLEFGIGEGDSNLVKACEQSFVHGVLLGLRYTMEELDFSSAAIQTSSLVIRNALHRLIGLLLRVTALALWVVSADALNMQERFALSPLDQLIKSGSGNYMVRHDSHQEDVEDISCMEGLAPVEQMVMVGCWLSMKEVSLVLGSVARRVPLPGSTFQEARTDQHYHSDETSMQTDNMCDGHIMLDSKQLESIGQHFLQVLLSMKHNGAIDKTRTGFTALCDRLLRSNDPRLNAMPEIWLRQLIQHTGANGQTVDDLLRRSAGIPAAFLALFLSEPEGAPKKLLPAAMEWIIETASDFVSRSSESTEVIVVPEMGDGTGCVARSEKPISGRSQIVTSENNGQDSKESNDGVVPVVHCFNVMRVAFHDTNLATDTSGFCAQGLVAAIQAFSCRHWEVRNSATLAFTALVHRTIGYLNVYKRESARRAITGFEFFHRYPVLHPFLLQELHSATWQLEHGPSAATNGGAISASKLHPSLGPVLLILSRLKPSMISNNVEDWLSPAAFMPYVTRCATQCNQQVRVLASRALAPLVGTEHLFQVLEGLAQSLPEMPDSKLQSRSGTPVTCEKFSFNAVHGVLLQMNTLLVSNCLGLPELEQRLKIFNRVAVAFEQRLWLGSVGLCSCYMVVMAFLQTLDALLEVERSCHCATSEQSSVFSSLDASLLHLCGQCLSHDWTVYPGVLDPSVCILRERAAHMYTKRGLSKWSPIEQHADPVLSVTEGARASSPQQSPQPTFSVFAVHLRLVLNDNMYEVRFAALKVLKNYFKNVPAGCIRTEVGIEVGDLYSRLLQPMLKERLDVERHPGCTRLLLEVFYWWSELHVSRGINRQPEDALSELLADSVWGEGLSALTLTRRLLVTYETSRQGKVKEVVLRCLGGCLKQIVRHRSKCNLLNLPTNCISSQQENPGGGDELNREWMELLGTECGLDAVFHLGSNGIKSSIDAFIGLVTKHSDASEGVKFRRAAADAIVASRLLEEAELVGPLLQSSQSQNVAPEGLEWYARGILQVWSIAVKLLEDEDQALRHKLSQSVMNVIAASRTYGASSEHRPWVAPAQVERVLQLSFDYLSAHFRSWTPYWDYLSDFVLAADNSNGSVDLVRRLFDKELDNHHEEELSFVQLSCLHLNRILHNCGADIEGLLTASPRPILHHNLTHGESTVAAERIEVLNLDTKSPVRSNPSGMSALSGQLHSIESGTASGSAAAQSAKLWADKWRCSLLQQSHQHVEAILQLQGRIHWLGGVTNHQDGFKPLYRILLGLLTVAGPSVGQEEQVVAGLLDLTNSLKQLPLNPLMSNTHLMLLRAYQRHLRADLSVPEFVTFMGSSFMDGFRPLFLLG